MALSDLKICGDTGWRTEPRYAPQDVLDSEGTIMHHLSNPSPKRTIRGYYQGDGSSFGVGLEGGADGIVLNVSGQRLQNVGDTQWWLITVELQANFE